MYYSISLSTIGVHRRHRRHRRPLSHTAAHRSPPPLSSVNYGMRFRLGRGRNMVIHKSKGFLSYDSRKVHLMMICSLLLIRGRGRNIVIHKSKGLISYDSRVIMFFFHVAWVDVNWK
ncbi:hypothetical protein QVD17_24395 [Tagetes erecta]|uniref:Uncharacterized protein n=1 Tax=Tagetes erecta TaxID=13708 RepID=A0AAD8KI26_TARER|nr:hypothetical protein QVD17_24395 [Tagetes erecta]